MAYKGKRIYNPVNKQIIEFLTTSKCSKGEQLEMISTWLPNSLKPQTHYHPFQEEIFTVIEGELTIQLQGRTYHLKEGEVVHLPSATPHSMWNETNKKVIANWRVFPALKTEFLLETGAGLAVDGKTNMSGRPALLQIVLLAKMFRKEFRLQKPSYLLQWLMFTLLTPFALLSGKKAIYPEYID